MDEKRLKEVFSDEAFVKELLGLEEPMQVQELLKEKGIEFTEDEIIVLRDEIIRLFKKVEDGGELSLEQMDEAAGGVFISSTAIAGVIVGAAVLIVGSAVVAPVSMGVAAAVGFGLSKLRW